MVATRRIEDGQNEEDFDPWPPRWVDDDMFDDRLNYYNPRGHFRSYATTKERDENIRLEVTVVVVIVAIAAILYFAISCIGDKIDKELQQNKNHPSEFATPYQQLAPPPPSSSSSSPPDDTAGTMA